MKLIIDIPEDMYNDADILIVKDLPELKKIIANGIPYEERPQGEWVIDNWGIYHCNHCMRIKQQLFNNFCGYCGTEMNNEKEKDNG